MNFRKDHIKHSRMKEVEVRDARSHRQGSSSRLKVLMERQTAEGRGLDSASLTNYSAVVFICHAFGLEGRGTITVVYIL